MSDFELDLLLFSAAEGFKLERINPKMGTSAWRASVIFEQKLFIGWGERPLAAVKSCYLHVVDWQPNATVVTVGEFQPKRGGKRKSRP
jgi:hypothetical protein